MSVPSIKPERAPNTLASAFLHQESIRPREPCLYFKDEAYTFQDIAQAARSLAAGLLEQGIRKGDKVGLLAPNCPEFLVCFVGVLMAGAVLVPINVKSKADDIEYLVNDAELRLVLFHSKLSEELYKVSSVPNTLLGVVNIGFLTESTEDEIHSRKTRRQTAAVFHQIAWADFLPATRRATDQLLLPEAQDEAIIFYTSGTTGRPKGAVCTHANCMATIESWIEALALNTDTCSLMVTPYFHNAFNHYVYSVLLAGGCSVAVEAFQVKTLLREVERRRVNFMFAVPPVYLAILNYPKRNAYDLSSLKKIAYGAAPMPIEVIKNLKEVFNCDLYHGYAQSETCPGISFLRPEFTLKKPGSVGQAIKTIELSIRDENGQPVPPGRIGEICCRGPNIMKCYFKRPEATREKFRGGWLNTGDMGYLDEEGFLYLAGRKDDLINSMGEKFYPSEVEEVLFQYPAVREAAIIGIPDPSKGQVVIAFIVPKANSEFLIAELRKYCISRLADYKVPKAFRIMDELPRNASGKVLKGQLARMVTLEPIETADERADSAPHDLA
jgi:acyl-CoA synthetase (AMP-forming)/AMP-acid ligase II